MIWVPAQLVGAFHGETVTLTCFVEAHPASLNYWEKDGVMIHQDDHYTVTQERGTPQYKVDNRINKLFRSLLKVCLTKTNFVTGVGLCQRKTEWSHKSPEF